jgi:putative DNA primase/helicase
MAQLTPRAIRVDNLTAAVMFRLIERDRPTLLIDEADTFLPGNKELRGVIDSGHASDGHFPRCAGKGHEPVAFNTFGPVALAGLGDVHPTVASRSITIELQRKLPSEKIDELMVDDFPFLEKLNRKALRWANDHADDLTRARPKMPPALANRARDNWWPLLAIADVAGGHWPETARKAALRLTAHNQGDQDVRVLLLRDLRVIFSEADGDKLTTRHILQALAKLDDGPWAEFRSGRAITAGQLSELLRPFHIAPSTIRMSTTTAKGYRREQFQDAWRRYLPAAD